jgi:hypothetical protein
MGEVVFSIGLHHRTAQGFGKPDLWIACRATTELAPGRVTVPATSVAPELSFMVDVIFCSRDCQFEISFGTVFHSWGGE